MDNENSIIITSTHRDGTTSEGLVGTEKVEASAPVEETQSVETPEESETLENSDGSEDQDGEESEGSDEQEQKAKPKKGFDKRISKLVKQRTEAQRELEYWKAEALKQKQQPQESDEPARQVEAPAVEGKPDVNSFDTHEAYLEALADWKLDQREIKRKESEKAEALKNEVKTRDQKYLSKVEEFKAQQKDWDDVLSQVADVKVPYVVTEEILNSELGPELTYALAQDPEEFERICGLPATQAIKAIGRIEDKIQATKSEAQTKEPKQTKAPKPLSAVSASSGSAVKKSLFDKTLSFAEYEKLRVAELKNK